MEEGSNEMDTSIESVSNPNEIIVYFQKQDESYTLDF